MCINKLLGKVLLFFMLILLFPMAAGAEQSDSLMLKSEIAATGAEPVYFPAKGDVAVAVQRVVDDVTVVEYVTLTNEMLKSFSDMTLQTLKDRIVADIVEHQAILIQAIRHSDEALLALTERKKVAYTHALSCPMSLEPEVEVTLIDIGDNIDREEPLLPLTIHAAANTGTAMTFGDKNRTSTEAVWGTGRRVGADARSECVYMNGSTEGSALSLVGTVVSVTGSGAREAEITVKGSYEAILQTVGITEDIAALAGAGMSIDVLICEFEPIEGKIGTRLAGVNILTPPVVATIMPNYFADNISSTFNVTLEADKSYIFAIGAYTEVYVNADDSITFALADMHSESGSGVSSAGVDFHSLEINWR